MILKETIAIELVEIEPNNFHLFVQARIGRRNARLLLDTGASKTAFDLNSILLFVKEKSLRNHEIQSVGLGSNQVLTQLSHLPVWKFGEIKLHKKEVAVLDLSHVNQAYQIMGFPNIDGVMGSDILMELHAVINYPKLTLTLKQKV